MKEKAIKLLKTGNSVKEVQEILQISEWTWRKLGLNKLDKYTNIFAEINEKSAYWLGFLWADSSLSKNILELEINTKDEGHLEKLAEALAYSHIPTIHRRTRHNADTSRISVSSKPLAESLRSLGFDLKGQRIVPKIDEKWIIHFIRGYFDGDGSFQLRIKKWKRRMEN